MPYLMFDIKGVLCNTVEQTDPDALLLRQIKNSKLAGTQVQKHEVLNDAERVVSRINQLVKHHGYKVVFHSGEPAAYQREFYRLLLKALHGKGLIFPEVVAAPSVDQEYMGNSANSPRFDNSKFVEIETDDASHTLIRYELPILGFYQTARDETKAGVRTALEAHLPGLGTQEEKKDSFVFEHGSKARSAAGKEKYSALRIGDLKLADALGQALRHARNKRITAIQNEVNSSTVSPGFRELMEHLTKRITAVNARIASNSSRQDREKNQNKLEILNQLQTAYQNDDIATVLDILRDERKTLTESTSKGFLGIHGSVTTKKLLDKYEGVIQAEEDAVKYALESPSEQQEFGRPTSTF